MKKLVVLFLALLMLTAGAQAATLVSTAGMGETVEPLEVIDDLATDRKAESTRPWAVLDNRSITSYSYIGWSHQLEDQMNALTFRFNNASISGMWMRTGDLTSEATYWSHARPKMVKVTINRMDGSSVALRYDMEDKYDLTTRSADWYDGYQKMQFDKTYTNVSSIDLHIVWYEGNSSASRHNVHISDCMFFIDHSMPATPDVSANTAPVQDEDPERCSDGFPELWGTAIKTIYTRSGPSTRYDEIDAFEVAGQRVQVISASYDSGNGIYWLQLDMNPGRPNHCRVYTGEQRVNIDVNRVPKEISMGTGTVLRDSNAYYGPGTDYMQRRMTVPAGTTGTIISYEKGYTQFDFRPSGWSTNVRVWILMDNIR